MLYDIYAQAFGIRLMGTFWCVTNPILSFAFAYGGCNDGPFFCIIFYVHLLFILRVKGSILFENKEKRSASFDICKSLGD